MVIPDSRIPLVGRFIHSAYSRPMDGAHLLSLIPWAKTILKSDYVGVLLLANKRMPSISYISNNDADYAALYREQLMPKDFLLRAMISGGRIATLSSFSSESYLMNRDFCVQAIRNRPIADLCYIPLRIRNYLAGFIGISRAGMDRRVSDVLRLGKIDVENAAYTPNDIDLISFIAGIIIDAYALTLESPRGSNEADAALDSGGTVLQAGCEIRMAMEDLFGADSWQTPCSGAGPYHAHFRRKFYEFLDYLAAGHCRSFVLSKNGHDYRFDFHLQNDDPLRLHFPHEPVVRLELRREDESAYEDDYFPDGLFRSRFALTPRESEVARLVFRAYSNKEISTTLGIEVPTVKRHLSTIFEKVGVSSRMQLLFALAGGESPPLRSKGSLDSI